MQLHIYDIIQQPVITEKIAKGQDVSGKYAFQVHPDANKKQIKAAVEKVFNVHVVRVNTINVSGKWRRVRYQPGKTANWKKAIVTLKKNEKIDITK
ncbi:MAG: 50S ribosomal protein L23 [Candidatus Omnitrophica bacterium]|nr:50S ribosomal protein L23 [Candidatus Omnitrophota bacterium]MDD5670927.1 50S ribosomal protein L23 [Candidatus Omnitrophota bacterium]